MEMQESALSGELIQTRDKYAKILREGRHVKHMQEWAKLLHMGWKHIFPSNCFKEFEELDQDNTDGSQENLSA